MANYLSLFFIYFVFGQHQFKVNSISEDEYAAHVQNWNVQEGLDGFIYIANQSALLIYNGREFKKVLVQGHVVRSIYVDSLSRVYFGGENNFGFIDHIHSENPSIHYLKVDSLEDIGLIYKVQAFKDHVYFGSLNRLYIYSPKKDDIYTITKSGTMRFPSIIQDKLVVHKYGAEAFEVWNHSFLKPFKQLEKFNSISFQNSVENSKGEHFLLSYPRLALDITGSDFKAAQLGIKSPPFLIYRGIINTNDEFVLATFNSGVLFSNKEGEIIRQVTEEDGLANNTVRDVKELSEGGYFVATNSGLSQIEVSFNKEEKLNGKSFEFINQIVQRNANTYVLHNKGLSIFSANGKTTFHKNNTPLIDIHFYKNRIFLLSENDVLELKSNRLIPFNFNLGETKALFHGVRSETVRILESHKILELNLLNQKLDILNRFQGNISNVVKTQKAIYFGSTIGTWKIEGEALFQLRKTQENLRVAYVDSSFLSFKTFGFSSAKNTLQNYITHIYGDSANIFHLNDFKSFIFARINSKNVLLWRENNSFRIDSLSYANLPTAAVNTSLYDSLNKELWLGTQSGLYRSSINRNRSFKQDLKLYSKAYRKDLQQNEYHFASSFPQASAKADAFDFLQASYHLKLTAPYFQRNSGLLFRYKLSGYANNWSAWGSISDAQYTDLSEGKYTFYAEVRDIYGNVASAIPLQFTILPPWYRTWWAYTIYIFGLGLVLFGSIKKTISVQQKKAAVLLEFQEAKAKAREAELRIKIEKENLRNRIASDLHDEIGSNLSTISMLSLLLEKSKIPDLKAKERLAKIKTITALSSHSMRDIVWFVNPENESFEKLISRMREVASMMLEDIHYSFDAKQVRGIDSQSMDFRRNIFLFYKECLQNILKHAKAGSVKISIFTENKDLILTVKDDGIGFDTAAKANGNGLANYKKRASAINGVLTVESVLNSGTTISLKVKLP